MSPASRFAFADILTVLDALPVGVLMVSPGGDVLHLNHAISQLTGFTQDDAVGLPCRHILRSRSCVAGCELGCRSFAAGGEAADPLSAGMLLSGELEELAKPGSRGLETDILTLKKRRVPVRLTHFPVLDSNGSELFRLDVVEDLSELKRLEHRLHQASGFGKLIGRSAPMERIASLIPSIAPSSAPVFITGETGTGKDILAETLHQASHRSREPFVRLNVSPLPEEMLTIEIFGQAFPDKPERSGRFQQAAGGTLYITEVADIPKGIQARLVSFLDTGGILPVGAMRESMPNVRLITATNQDPQELVSQGALSAELYHRLNVARLDLPPLRERREDIDFLLQHFIDVYATRFKKELRCFAPEARALLSAHDYPGNVRELRNIVEYAAMVCPGPEIGLYCLPAYFAQMFGQAAAPPRPDTAKKGARLSDSPRKRDARSAKRS